MCRGREQAAAAASGLGKNIVLFLPRSVLNFKDFSWICLFVTSQDITMIRPTNRK